jgi:LPS-assembly lipoprotein
MSLPEAGGTLRSSGIRNGTFRAVRARSLTRAIVLLCAVSPILTACGGSGFRPLNATASYGGANANEKFAHVDIVTIPGRVGQRIRNELIFQTTGGGEAKQPTMRLEIAIRESIISTLVTTTGDAQGQIYNLEAAFKLVRISDNSVVLTGTSYARAGFERFESIFSNVRAREDAENRAANTIGEDLKSRLTAYLAGAA